ncbi:hypothetical protein [Tenacibaculum sp.]|uniref:hypothetical protein n=1 Tax=Tenacibaculum sp. TaxID=1906242 RepID=UPI003AA8A830
MIALEFLKSELKSHSIELTPKTDGREEVDFLIGTHYIYLQPLDLDTTQRSIKIAKQDFKISSKFIEELEKYALKNMAVKLKV